MANNEIFFFAIKILFAYAVGVVVRVSVNTTAETTWREITKCDFGEQP